MKSPAALQHKLTQDWHKDKTRLARLCTDAFPITLAIGLPKAADIGSAAVRAHLERWHDFARHNIGTILWQEKKYQACFAPIACPRTGKFMTCQNGRRRWIASKRRQSWAGLSLFAQPDLQHTPEQFAVLVKHKALAIPYDLASIRHLLPPFPDTLIIAGSGHNLAWLKQHA